MTINIGLKGFGRIGHLFTRLTEEDSSLDMRVVAIAERNNDHKLNNETIARQHLANLLSDSAYGQFGGTVSVPKEIDGDTYKFDLNGREVVLFFNRGAAYQIDWSRYDVDVLIDASLTADKPQTEKQIEELRRCLTGTVKRAVVACPHKYVDKTLIVGVNEDQYDPAKHQVVSASSCTGNAAAPVVDLIDQNYGITYADIETIHPMQNFESAVDGVGLTAGMARGSVGNVKSVDTAVVGSVVAVLPHLKNIKFNTKPLSFRTPTASGCFMRYDLGIKEPVQGGAEEINSLLQAAAEGPLKGIIGYHEPLMGVMPPNALDVKGMTYAVLISPQSTTAYQPFPDNKGNIIRLLGLHDTELGYSACVARTIKEMEKRGL